MGNVWTLEWLLLIVMVVDKVPRVSGSLWQDWWTYGGVSGPDNWGKANKAWAICSKGKYQSPINIVPEKLVFDPHLSYLNMSDHKIKGVFMNTGRDLKFIVKNMDDNPFTFSGGPFSYKYTLFEMKVHFGDNNSKGSEHSIGGRKFPVEIQLYGFNSEIHKNSSTALNSPNGIGAISILVRLSNFENRNIEELLHAAEKVPYKGSKINLNGFSVNNILPDLDFYVTYEGSITQPGCMETVTWVIVNKSIQMSRSQISMLRKLTTSNGAQAPLMTNNFRSMTPSHGRLIRTNIKYKGKDEDCYTIKQTSYEVNQQFRQESTK